MGKRTWSVALSLALIAGVFSALPAKAQEAPTSVPEVVNIEDPLNDANYLNDQSQPGVCVVPISTCVSGPDSDDNPTPADVHSGADIMKVWFSHTSDQVSAHMQVESPPPKAAGLYYVVYATPAEGTVASSTLGCIRFVGLVGGKQQGQNTTWHGPDYAKFFDHCNEGSSFYSNGVEAELKVESLEDGTGIITVTGPRSLSPLLADGLSLAAPQGQVRHLIGEESVVGFSANGVIDTTKPGTDYTLTAGGGTVTEPQPPVEAEPPGKGDPPGKGKKKGCGKGKGKKKGACPGKKPPKPPAAAECPAYVPGEHGAEAETSIVTDAATEEAPVVVETEAEMGGPTSPFVDAFDFRSFVFQNVQVDSKNRDAGLYVKIEFTDGHDYDLGLFHSDGTEAASSGESQPEPGLGAGSPDGAWEGGSNYEFLKGIRTADCAGYTARVAGYLTTGGPVTISMWLGEVVGDPAAPEGETAMEMFYRMLGL